VCDAACQAAGVAVAVDPLTGFLTVTDPAQGGNGTGGGVSVSLDPATVPGLVGSIGCLSARQRLQLAGAAAGTATTASAEACSVAVMSLSSGGIKVCLVEEAVTAHVG